MSNTHNQDVSLYDPINGAQEDMDSSALPYLLFAIGEGVYGINSEFVISIETLRKLTSVVGSAPHIRGGLIYDGEFILLVDMRKRFGLDSLIDEFTKSVNPEQRMKDHENWVSALEKSVLDNTEFMLTDDPHMCAFGKWLYSYKTTNNVLNHQLNKIELPHTEVHNTAKKVKKLMAEKKRDEALSAINEMRATHYRTTVSMLSTLKDIVAANLRELFIVVKSESGMVGIIVDSIVGIESLTEELPLPATSAESEYVKFISRRKGSEAPIMVLDSAMVDSF